MKLFSIKPYDYADENTPKDSPWADESFTGDGHFLLFAEDELDAREIISKKDNGEILAVMCYVNESPFSKACRESLGVGVASGRICPFMDRNYTECKELIPDSEGVIIGDAFIF